jgi:urease accessory protein UreF
MAYTGGGGRQPCELCGQLLTNNGAARYSHRQRHKREGLLDEWGELTEAGRSAREARRALKATGGEVKIHVE